MTTEDVLGGVHVKPGDTVILSAYLTQRMVSVWLLKFQVTVQCLSVWAAASKPALRSADLKRGLSRNVGFRAAS